MARERVPPFVKFLGTGGARFVMTRQLRSTGGFWVGYRETFLHVDPGPGALVRCHASRPPLKPERLSAVVLSHRHIDHCNDASVIVEAMTLAGTRRRGAVFCPEDCLTPHSVLFPHVLELLPASPVVLRPGQRHEVGDIVLRVPLRHRHPVETYGFIFEMGDIRLAYVADTAFFEDLIPAYRGCDVVILNVTLAQPKAEVQHLSLPEAFELVVNLDARVTVLTHFGMEVLRSKPWTIAQEWTQKTGRTVLAAEDGRYLDLAALLEK
jgi:ribonuclease BN (tRNA processing enzyme)